MEPTAEDLAETPTLFTQRELVDNLTLINRPKHYWHALVWIEAKRGKGEYTDEKIDEVIGNLERALGELFKEFVAKFREEGRSKDRAYHNWRSNQTGREDDLHLYDTGAIPPRLFCWPDGEPIPDDSEELIECQREILEWTQTPTARALVAAGIDLEEIRTHAESLIDACEKDIEAQRDLARSTKNMERLRANLELEQRKFDANAWLFQRMQSGDALKWSAEFGLPALRQLSERYLSSHLKPALFWQEISKVEGSGDLAKLERALSRTDPAEAKAVSRLRALIPDAQWKPFGNA